MRNRWKKLLSLLIACMMLICEIPADVLATQPEADIQTQTEETIPQETEEEAPIAEEPAAELPAESPQEEEKTTDETPSGEEQPAPEPQEQPAPEPEPQQPALEPEPEKQTEPEQVTPAEPEKQAEPQPEPEKPAPAEEKPAEQQQEPEKQAEEKPSEPEPAPQEPVEEEKEPEPDREMEVGKQATFTLAQGDDYVIRLKGQNSKLLIEAEADFTLVLEIKDETTEKTKTLTGKDNEPFQAMLVGTAGYNYLLTFTAKNGTSTGTVKVTVTRVEEEETKPEEKQEEKEEPAVPAEDNTPEEQDEQNSEPVKEEEPKEEKQEEEKPEEEKPAETQPEEQISEETTEQEPPKADHGVKEEKDEENQPEEKPEEKEEQPEVKPEEKQEEQPEEKEEQAEEEPAEEPEEPVPAWVTAMENGEEVSALEASVTVTPDGEDDELPAWLIELEPQEQEPEGEQQEENVEQTEEPAEEQPEEQSEEQAEKPAEEPAEEEPTEEIEQGTEEGSVELAPWEITVNPLSEDSLDALLNLLPNEGTGRKKLKIRWLPASYEDEEETSTGYAAYDISLKEQKDAEAYLVEVRLSEPIALPAKPDAEIEKITCVLYHLHEDEDGNKVLAETITEQDGLKVTVEDGQITGFSFTTTDFSDFILKYTVEFRYENRTFDMEVTGAQEVALSAILAELEIPEDEVIAEVSVSDSEVVSVTETEDDWMICVRKETEQPETLTVRMESGKEYSITLQADGSIEVSTADNAVVITAENDLYLPEDAVAYAVPLTEEQSEAVASAVETPAAEEAQTENQVYSIGLENVDTEEYEGFGVSVNLDEGIEGKDFRLYQVEDGEATDITDTLELKTEENVNGRQEVTGFSFSTDTFADYVLSYILETYYTAFDGTTFHITLDYGPEAGIPADAQLKVREILPETEEYEHYLTESAAQLNVSNDAVTFARFFDIEIEKDGEKIEPQAPVQVKITYNDALELGEDSQLSIVHFADDETEVITDVTVSADNTELTYQQDSFSVTGTIVTAPDPEKEEEHYVILIKKGSSYYVLENDGTLSLPEKINYQDDGYTIKTIEMINPIFWTFTKEDDGEYSVWHHEDALDYWGDLLPQTYKSKYLNAEVGTGTVTINDGDEAQTIPTLQYANNHLSSNNQYIGVVTDDTGMHICGQCTSDQAATIYLVKAENVEYCEGTDLIYNHMVNHIDISVAGMATMKMPLAYGSYKLQKVNTDGTLIPGEFRDKDLKVSVDEPLTLVVKQDVAINDKDLRKADITTYTKDINGNKTPINDAYIVTGYSKNAQGSGQIRLEGAFKVANVAPVPKEKENPEDPEHPIPINKPNEYIYPDGQKVGDLRLANRIYYDLAVSKEITFRMTYTDTDGTVYAVLRDGEHPFDITTEVSLSTTFDFWDPENECPGVSWIYDPEKWLAGDIPDNSGWSGYNHVDGGPGMDFSLKVLTNEDEDDDHTILAIEVTKYIQGEDSEGNLHYLTLQRDTDCLIHVYQGLGTNAGPSGDLVLQHDKTLPIKTDGIGLIYDYDLFGGTNAKPAYVKIAEDPSSVADVLYDASGKKWLYVKTKIDTEYVWRDWDSPSMHEGAYQNKAESSQFYSDTEIIGEYRWAHYPDTYEYKGQIHDGNEFNGFLEFYIYNVYKPAGYLKINKAVTENGDEPATEAVKKALAGEYTFTVYTDNKCKNAYLVYNETTKKWEALTLTIEINDDGEAQDSDTVELPIGKYWIVETEPEGDVILTTEQPVEVTVTDTTTEETPAVAEFENDIETGTLNVTKTVTGDYIPTSDTYTFTVMRGDKYVNAAVSRDTATYNALSENEVTYSIKANQTLSFVHMPAAVYTVTEKTITKTGYEITTTYKIGDSEVDPAEAEVSKDDLEVPVTVEIVNHYRSAELVITKKITGITPQTAAAGIRVTVTDREGNILLNNLPLTSSPFSLAGDTYIARIRSTDNATYAQYLKPDGEYQVTETIDSEPDGYGFAGGTYSISAKEIIEGAKAESGVPYDLQLTDADVSRGRIDFTNTYQKATPPHKMETSPSRGIGEQSAVKVGDTIIYQIDYTNYKSVKTKVTITDILDEHVAFEYASDGGSHDTTNHTVTWTIDAVPGPGHVTLHVKVLEGALKSKEGPGYVKNGGESATVQVGTDSIYTLEEVINPVPDAPKKKEIVPYEGTGVLGPVKVGDEITYQIDYKNYKSTAATVTIVDTLDENLQFKEATPVGEYEYNTETRRVTWTLDNIAGGRTGKVTLTAIVLPGALKADGTGKVANGGDNTTVKVGTDPEYTVEVVENPVPKAPEKKEKLPYQGINVLGAVKVGDEITYEINYHNYKKEAATVTIKDKLDDNVEFLDASDDGTENDGTVTWTINAAAGKKGTVTLKVRVKESALKSKGGHGEVVNGGTSATVQVGTDPEFTLNEVKNPVPEPPVKTETKPYSGNGVLGAVKVDDEITYRIDYNNYTDGPAKVVIVDTLDKNVEYVDSSDNGKHVDGVVTWTFNEANPGPGFVTLTVKVKKEALVSENGPGKVVNGEDSAWVQVNDDNRFTLDKVENPVPEPPAKAETDPYKGTDVLGGVKVGDLITYTISYRNYKTQKATILITDTLDEHVEFVSASDDGANLNGTVKWTLKNVKAGKEGTVTLTVRVKESALESKGGTGTVINGGENATVKVGNDNKFTLDKVENPVPEPPVKQELHPYKGNGVLGAVKVGEEITYEISYENYKSETSTITIKDTLDKNVEFVSASEPGTNSDGIVTWTFKAEPGAKGTVTLTVRVLDTALKSKDGPGKVVNGGDTATVQVGDDHEFTLDSVENPVPEPPVKMETKPYEGTGELGAVKVGELITYTISYKNYKTNEATILITDKLDDYVEFVEAYDGVEPNEDRIVTWTLQNVKPDEEGTVTLTVRVKEEALHSKEGPGKVSNGGSVQVDNDNAFILEEVENPVPEEPKKHEITPYQGTGELGQVKVGDTITYQIDFSNYQKVPATVTIIDPLDKNVAFESASDEGKYDPKKHTVTWTLENKAPGDDNVTLTVTVLESALTTNEGPGEVVNGGEGATVQVGNDHAYTLNKVSNPLPKKTETKPYQGIGLLGPVKVNDLIEYQIDYKNYKQETATVIITDKLDDNVELVEASHYGTPGENNTVIWELEAGPGETGSVTVTVRVLPSALNSNIDSDDCVIVNGGKSTTIKIGQDDAVILNTVENPVPRKKETAPYTGTGELGQVKVGDTITYQIDYKNYKNKEAEVTIKDQLDLNVKYISSEPKGSCDENGLVTWKLNVGAGASGHVTVTVEVLPSALTSEEGPWKVVNGGDTASVQVDHDAAVTLNAVENPIPRKKETKPYTGIGELGQVKVGDQITYRIDFKNYTDKDTTVTITDTLDSNVKFISSEQECTCEKGVVTWKVDTGAGQAGYVTLTVEVLEGALTSTDGPGRVANGGEGATVKVGDGPAVALNTVENPVPVKKEIVPVEGVGHLRLVEVGQQITYRIDYKNYKGEDTTVKIVDTLDPNVKYISSEPKGKYDKKSRTVKWEVPAKAGEPGYVTLTVEVLESALTTNDGMCEVVNDGTKASVQVGNDKAVALNTVTNPVPKKKEIAPFEGVGELGLVSVGQDITYEIDYKNYKDTATTVIITDELDPNVEYAGSKPEGSYDPDARTVTWTIPKVEAGKEDSVTLSVVVKESALPANGGMGSVVNGGEKATVKIGEDPAVKLNAVKNPVPQKQEFTPFKGRGKLGMVPVDGEITYEIFYRNYKKTPAGITITDKLDKNVQFVSCDPESGEYDSGTHTVTWKLTDVPAQTSDSVKLTVKVKEGALLTKGGPGEVINDGETATVQVEGDPEVKLNTVTNPVPEKKEIDPYEGSGELGLVSVGQEITYQIDFKNYKDTPATITVTDQLDKNVEFVSAGPDETGVYDEETRTVTWTLDEFPAGEDGSVTLTVKVLESALSTNGGPCRVVNDGKTATVQVDNDPAITLNTVENPVPEKKEITPYKGIGELGSVAVGQKVTYEIDYRNTKKTAATIVITDKLDKNVQYVSSAPAGVYEASTHTVTWTLKDVAAGKDDKVTLTVQVLESALTSNGGPGKVINDGDTATVQVGDDPTVTLNSVENPIPEKKEIAPYEGTGSLGYVSVGQEVTYQIDYKNYKTEPATVIVTDKLDENVSYVSSMPSGSYDESTHTVTWTLEDVTAGQEGSVTLTVKVLESALSSNGGPCKVVNGGENASVKVGDDPAVTLNTVENPIPEKREVSPYTGNGKLGAVAVDQNVTYEIDYRNYKGTASMVVITDKLDKNVRYESSSPAGRYDSSTHTVTWTLENVPAGKADKVSVTVKVLESALTSKGGKGRVVNDGKNATVKVGDDPAVTLNSVENPVPEPPKKIEVAPYKGTGKLGEVKIDQEITYEIHYKNYKDKEATVVITDLLDQNVRFVSADNKGSYVNGVVTWIIDNVPAGGEGKVTVKVQVRDGARRVGKVANRAGVKVGNDEVINTDEVWNPVIGISPKTGDDSRTGLWIALLVILLLGAGFFGVKAFGKKKNKASGK